MKKKPIIVLCASVSFYERLIPIEEELQNLGFEVVVPITLRKMQQRGNFDETVEKTWFKNPADYVKKQRLMVDHFEKIIKGDAVLVVNYEKKGLQGYIGGNVLMEMTAGFLNHKPVFVLNDIDQELPIKEEVYGLLPNILYGDLGKLKELIS